MVNLLFRIKNEKAGFTQTLHILPCIVLLLALFPLNSTIAGTKTEIAFFYQNGCPHSRRVKAFLNDRVAEKYSVEIKKYEIHRKESAQLFVELTRLYGEEAADVRRNGVPAVFLGGRSFQDDSRAVMRKIEQYLRRICGRMDVPGPLERLKLKEEEIIDSSRADPRAKGGSGDGVEVRLGENLNLAAVMGAAAVDAVNPCACAVLTVLLASILAVSKRKKRTAVITSGLAFTVAVFICYLLIGFGLISAIDIWGIEDAVFAFAAAAAVIVGLWNIKDGLWYGKGASIEVPESWRPRMKKITKSVVSAPGAFIIGIIVSFFLLPCTSGPYVVIIGMLSKSSTRIIAVWYLLLYNFIFVIPFIVITLLVAFGLAGPHRIEQWRKDNVQKFHLVTGIFMLVLGIILLVTVFL